MARCLAALFCLIALCLAADRVRAAPFVWSMDGQVAAISTWDPNNAAQAYTTSLGITVGTPFHAVMSWEPPGPDMTGNYTGYQLQFGVHVDLGPYHGALIDQYNTTLVVDPVGDPPAFPP